MKRRVVSGVVEGVQTYEKEDLVYSVLKLSTFEGERHFIYGGRLSPGFRSARVVDFIETCEGNYWDRKIHQEVRFSNPDEDCEVEFDGDYEDKIRIDLILRRE